MPKEPAVHVRRSRFTDLAALGRLAGLSGRLLSSRTGYLVAEVRHQIVAAVPLDGSTPPLHDPARDTSDIQVLLTRWAANLRRHPLPLQQAA